MDTGSISITENYCYNVVKELICAFAKYKVASGRIAVPVQDFWLPLYSCMHVSYTLPSLLRPFNLFYSKLHEVGMLLQV